MQLDFFFSVRLLSSPLFFEMMSLEPSQNSLSHSCLFLQSARLPFLKHLNYLFKLNVNKCLPVKAIFSISKFNEFIPFHLGFFLCIGELLFLTSKETEGLMLLGSSKLLGRLLDPLVNVKRKSYNTVPCFLILLYFDPSVLVPPHSTKTVKHK